MHGQRVENSGFRTVRGKIRKSFLWTGKKSAGEQPEIILQAIHRFFSVCSPRDGSRCDPVSTMSYRVVRGGEVFRGGKACRLTGKSGVAMSGKRFEAAGWCRQAVRSYPVTVACRHITSRQRAGCGCFISGQGLCRYRSRAAPVPAFFRREFPAGSAVCRISGHSVLF